MMAKRVQPDLWIDSFPFTGQAMCMLKFNDIINEKKKHVSHLF